MNSALVNLKSLLVKTRGNRLSIFLSILVFCAPFIDDNSMGLGAAIFCLEVLFLALYLIALKEFPPVFSIIKSNRVILTIFLLWFVSSTYSFLSSPYDLLHKPLAVKRLCQTLTHLFTFFFLWDYFNRYRPNLNKLFIAIPLSTLYVLAAFSWDWPVMVESLKLGETYYWFNNPPFNSHIRHTGYQASTALGVLLTSFIFAGQLNFIKVIRFLVLTAIWAFVFWLGGRAAVLSVIGTFILILIVLRIKNFPCKGYSLTVLCSGVIGLILSEYFSVMVWNGIIVAIQRSLDAETLNALSSDRLKIWATVWESVKETPFFGLGAQSYRFMPNRIFGTQPHSIFSQFLIEWGFVGGLLFISLLLKGFWTGVKLHILNGEGGLNPAAMAAGAVITTLSIHALPGGTYYHALPSFYLVLAFAVWVTPPVGSSPDKYGYS